MQKYGILKLVSVILVITVCAFLAYNEVKKNNIRTGIDIRGGIYAVLEPDIDKSSLTDDEIDKGLESAKTILGKRLDAKNIFDRSINIDSVNDRIIIEIPWAAGETNFNPQDQLNELGKTALLTFQEVDEDKVDENGIYLPTGKIIIQGNQVKDANAAPYQEQGSWVVALELDESGSEAFAEATGRLVGKPIAIFMDDQLISAPIVNQKIEAEKPS
ncbi:preprotein translocase subunit SecD [Thermoclostridium stercorarium]|uniref:preprotein translocase subunit SecD n=1 Tax=Thermoclostridium stercorarium TaxID=1510 RepID=UPI000ACF670D|nr:hypothetical protein [Thermoclostridium stercorarium]